MPTKISYREWDGGGSGTNKLIGYCKEEPFEVLKKVILTHNIYHYLMLYRPIDYDFPNNVSGLIIDKADTKMPKGLKVEITGSFDDLILDLGDALTRHKRTQKTILDSLKRTREWYGKNPLIDEIEEFVRENIQ